MSRNTVIINFSAPPKLAKDIEKQAKKQDKTKSQLIREAITAYTFNKRLEALQVKGEEIAEKLGLESYDDIEEFIESDENKSRT